MKTYVRMITFRKLERTVKDMVVTSFKTIHHNSSQNMPEVLPLEPPCLVIPFKTASCTDEGKVHTYVFTVSE